MSHMTTTTVTASIWSMLALLALPISGARQGLPRTPVDVSALGPQVGERVPDFRLKDQAGNTWTLPSVMGPNGAMLVFFRSADW